MPLSVDARQRVTDKVAKKWAERRKQNLMRALDDGWLVFAKGKPRERLAGYLANTLDIDVSFASDPDYLTKLERKEVPLMYAIQRVQQRQIEAGIPDPLTGQPMEPPTPAPPMLWPIVLSGKLPPYVFIALARDFRDLLASQAQNEPDRTVPYGVRSGGV